jgi:hypothetical protein
MRTMELPEIIELIKKHDILKHYRKPWDNNPAVMSVVFAEPVDGGGSFVPVHNLCKWVDLKGLAVHAYARLREEEQKARDTLIEQGVLLGIDQTWNQYRPYFKS